VLSESCSIVMHENSERVVSRLKYSWHFDHLLILRRLILELLLRIIKEFCFSNFFVLLQGG